MNQAVSHLRAVSLAITGFTCWVLCDSVIKLIGHSELPNYEIVAFLGVFMAAFIAVYAMWRGEMRELWPKKPRRLLARSCLDIGNNLCVVIALRHLSLTLFYVLVFTSPMMVALLERVFLKESLDWRKACAILAGFLGLVIAVYPSRSSGSSAWIGVAACAVCVTCFSIAIVWSRVIAQAERAESMAFFSGVVTGLAGVICMLAHAVPLNARQTLALLTIGLLGAIGSICIFTALKHTKAATVSQYHYTQLVSGATVAYFAFHEKPTAWMLAGAVLIVAAGLYIALRAPHEQEQIFVARAATMPSTPEGR